MLDIVKMTVPSPTIAAEYLTLTMLIPTLHVQNKYLIPAHK